MPALLIAIGVGAMADLPGHQHAEPGIRPAGRRDTGQAGTGTAANTRPDPARHVDTTHGHTHTDSEAEHEEREGRTHPPRGNGRTHPPRWKRPDASAHASLNVPSRVGPQQRNPQPAAHRIYGGRADDRPLLGGAHSRSRCVHEEDLRARSRQRRAGRLLRPLHPQRLRPRRRVPGASGRRHRSDLEEFDSVVRYRFGLGSVQVDEVSEGCPGHRVRFSGRTILDGDVRSGELRIDRRPAHQRGPAHRPSRGSRRGCRRHAGDDLPGQRDRDAHSGGRLCRLRDLRQLGDRRSAVGRALRPQRTRIHQRHRHGLLRRPRTKRSRRNCWRVQPGDR